MRTTPQYSIYILWVYVHSLILKIFWNNKIQIRKSWYFYKGVSKGKQGSSYISVIHKKTVIYRIKLLKSIDLDCGSEVVCIIFSNSSVVDILVTKGRETEGKTGRVTEGTRGRVGGRGKEKKGGGGKRENRSNRRQNPLCHCTFLTWIWSLWQIHWTAIFKCGLSYLC